MGNHEAIMLDACRSGHRRTWVHWLTVCGGIDTLASYGYQGKKTVIFGHTPTYKLYQDARNYSVYFGENNIIGIDGGAVFGGQLHALEWPSKHITSVSRTNALKRSFTSDQRWRARSESKRSITFARGIEATSRM